MYNFQYEEVRLNLEASITGKLITNMNINNSIVRIEYIKLDLIECLSL